MGNATKFVDAMEFMETVFENDELHKTLGSLSDTGKLAAKKFILESLPFHQKELLERSMKKDDAAQVNSVLMDPSWYSEWEVPKMQFPPLGVMFAAHQSHLLLNPDHTTEPHKWDDAQ